MARPTDPPHWALSVVVTEEFLNAMSRTGLRDGVHVDAFHQSFAVPMMGTVELSVAMSITAVDFQMRASDRGRLRATVSASGWVSVLGASPMQLPGPVRVRGEVLVKPIVRLRRDGSFEALLDVAGSRLVATYFDGVDGVPTDADALAQMGEMLFAAVGGELFEGLAGQLGSVGLQLDPGTAAVLAEVGCRAAGARITVQDGRLIVGMPAVEGLAGHAVPPGPVGAALGVGAASGALSSLVSRLAEDRLGTRLPVELQVTSTERRVGTALRNRRLVDSSLLPDLRAEWRTTLRPRLIDGHVEIGLRESWFEIPLLPAPVNQLSRWLGGVAARAPLSIRIPARGSIPVRPNSDHRLELEVSGIDITDHGVAVTVDARL